VLPVNRSQPSVPYRVSNRQLLAEVADVLDEWMFKDKRFVVNKAISHLHISSFFQHLVKDSVRLFFCQLENLPILL